MLKYFQYQVDYEIVPCRVYHYISIFKNMLKVLGNITIYQT